MFDLPFIAYLYNKSAFHYAAREYMVMICQKFQSTENLN